MDYIDSTFLTDYATARNVDLTSHSADEIGAAIVQGCDYVDSLAPYMGAKTDPEQDREFPRTGMVINTYTYADDVTPIAVQKASAEATLHVLDGDDLLESQTNGVTREKVDVIEIEYSENKSNSGTVTYPRIVSLLRPFRTAGKLRLAR